MDYEVNELAEKYGFGVAAVIEHYKNAGTPCCAECKKDYEKVGERAWKPVCEHGENLKLVVG